MFQNPWLLMLRKIFQKKNLHAFHPPEHVTETRPEIPLELRSYFHRVNIPPPLLPLVKNSSLRERTSRWHLAGE